MTERQIEVFHGAGEVSVQVIPFGPLLEALMSAPGAPVDPVVLRELSSCSDQRFWLLREVQESLERVAGGPVIVNSVHRNVYRDVTTELGTSPAFS